MSKLTVASVRAMSYVTEPVPLHRVKPGGRIEHDGQIYRIFRFLRIARPDRPLGCVAIAVPYDALGNALDETVALCFADTNEMVRQVCVVEVPR